MSQANRDTLPHQDSQIRPTKVDAGSWILALEYRRPVAGSVCVNLDDVDEITIGRGDERSVLPTPDGRRGMRIFRVPDPFMSRAHARLVRFGPHWSVMDLDSKNGLLINGTPSRRAQLADGDTVEIGQSMFCYRQRQVRGGAGRAPTSPPELATFHAPLAEQLAELERIAASAIPILLLGETGTGKEVLARAAHQLSRRDGAFVAVNCASIPHTLIESELFGHRRGAFSGASEDRLGLIRSADGGTLFLDEIGELPPPAQAALLRVLHDHLVTAVGDVRPVKVDLRVIAATNRDLPSLVASETFRSDLYARLAGLVLRLPPLRHRPEDLGELVAAVLRRVAGEVPVAFTKTAGRALFSHAWPFNVRELDKCLATAVALACGGVIDVVHLKLPGSTPSNATTTATGAPVLAEGSYTEDDQRRRAQLVEVLVRHHGNVAAVARELRKAPVQIYRWMQRYGIRPDDFRA